MAINIKQFKTEFEENKDIVFNEFKDFVEDGEFESYIEEWCEYSARSGEDEVKFILNFDAYFDYAFGDWKGSLNFRATSDTHSNFYRTFGNSQIELFSSEEYFNKFVEVIEDKFNKDHIKYHLGRREHIGKDDNRHNATATAEIIIILSEQ